MTANNRKYAYTYEIGKVYGSYKILYIFKHPKHSYRMFKYICVNCDIEKESVATYFHQQNKTHKCNDLIEMTRKEKVDLIENFKQKDFIILKIYGKDKKNEYKAYIKLLHLKCNEISYKFIHTTIRARMHNLAIENSKLCHRCACKNHIGRQSHEQSKTPFYKWFYIVKKSLVLDDEWTVFENFKRDLYEDYEKLVKYKSPIYLLPLDPTNKVSKSNYLLTIRDTKYIWLYA